MDYLTHFASNTHWVSGIVFLATVLTASGIVWRYTVKPFWKASRLIVHRVKRISEVVEDISKDYAPNSGSSLRDQVDTTRDQGAQMLVELRNLREHLETHVIADETVQSYLEDQAHKQAEWRHAKGNREQVELLKASALDGMSKQLSEIQTALIADRARLAVMTAREKAAKVKAARARVTAAAKVARAREAAAAKEASAKVTAAKKVADV